VTYLLVGDLDLHRKRITIRRAKGGEPNEYPLPADLVQPLRRYLGRRHERGPYLFASRQATNQKGMAQQRVRQLFKHYAEAAVLPDNLASHALRHSIAIHALQEGFGLEYIADLLGHTSTRSTAIYARIIAPAREAMMRRLDVSRHIVSWR
jgi:site-specific recombinase XerD